MAAFSSAFLLLAARLALLALISATVRAFKAFSNCMSCPALAFLNSWGSVPSLSIKSSRREPKSSDACALSS